MDDLLAKFALSEHLSAIGKQPELPTNICSECKIPMNLHNTDYICEHCQQIVPSDERFEHGDTTAKGIRKCFGSSDPLREQRQNVYDALIARHENAVKNACVAPSVSVLSVVAATYHDLEIANRAAARAMHRGEVKNDIIAAILFFECIRAREIYAKKEIAAFMGLRNDGFSRGCEQLRRQSALGNLKRYDEKNLCNCMIEYYYCAIFSEIGPAIGKIFKKFMKRIISCANKFQIGMQSQISSKIIGTIWAIILVEHYPISAQVLDSASGGIKKSTFVKFTREIFTKPRLRAIANDYFPQLRNPEFAKSIPI